MASRRALLLALLAVTPALAGCNFSDFYNKLGTVNVHLAVVGPQDSDIGEFQTLEVAIYGVSLRQYLVVNPNEFAFDPPLVLDFAAMARAGETRQLSTGKFNMRALDAVTLRIDVVAAIDVSGKRLPACHPNQPVESRPCVSTPVGGAYRFEDQQFSPPRGGSLDYHFPLAVHYDAPSREYYIAAEPDARRMETHR